MVAELELSAARSAAGTSATRLNVALEASSIWEQDLRTGAIDMDERCAALYGLDGATHFDSAEDMQARFVHRDGTWPPSARPCSTRRRANRRSSGSVACR